MEFQYPASHQKNFVMYTSMSVTLTAIESESFPYISTCQRHRTSVSTPRIYYFDQECTGSALQYQSFSEKFKFINSQHSCDYQEYPIVRMVSRRWIAKKSLYLLNSIANNQNCPTHHAKPAVGEDFDVKVGPNPWVQLHSLPYEARLVT